MATIVKNNDGKKLWGDDNCIYFKSICATYKLHYKDYRGTTIYDEATVDVSSGENVYNIHAASNVTRYLDLEFFDENGNKFLPYNWEYITKLKGDSGGNGLLTVFGDGRIRIVIENKLEDISASAYNHVISLVWDEVNEPIDERKVTVSFDFAQ